jgi:hypothetical protein
MGKQWLYLIALAFILMGFFAAWDFTVTLTGKRDTFEYSVNQISPQLYEGLEEHFQTDPKLSVYDQEAQSVEDLQYFAPPAVPEN